MSFVNELAFKEKVGDFEIIGNLEVGGNILLDGEFPKVNQMMSLKTDVATTNSLTSDVNLKANQSEMDAMETTINTTLNTKASQSSLDALSALTAEQNSDLSTTLATKATLTEMNTALDLKVDQTDVDTSLALKANQTDVDTSLALKANQTDVDTSLALKVDQTDVDTSLAFKANQTDVDSSLALKANQADIENLATQANLTDVNTTVASHTTSLASQDGLIQGLYDADYASIALLNARNYATEGWVNDKDYATESFVTSSVVSTGAISTLIDVAVSGYASTSQLSATNQSVADVLNTVETEYVERPEDWNVLSSPDGLKSYVEEKVLAGENIVRKPEDWTTYPSGNFGGLPPTLRSYTDGKLNEVQEGIQSYMKLRDYSVDASGNRSGETRIDFLRTTPVEAFGSAECLDWRLSSEADCGFNIYRKGTHPTLGNIYDGNVIEFHEDGDVNIPKVNGLKVNGNEVATKSYSDTTFATIGVEQSVSDLSTTSSGHGQRLVTIENAGYATTSQLSPYALSSSLGTTNKNLSGVDTRVGTLENAGYVTSAGLSGYNFATQGYVQDNLPDVSNFVTSSTLSTNHYTKTETDTAIPDVSNFVTSSTLSTNHYTKTETDTAISNGGGSSSFTELGINTSDPKATLHVGTRLHTQSDKNTIPTANIGASTAFPSTTHAWFANRFNSTDDDYWGLAVGTIYDGASYLQNLNKQVADRYYDILLQPNGGNVGIATDSPNAKLDVNGSTRSGYNTNTTSYFGRSAIGYVGHNDWAGFAHLDMNNGSDYALLQSSAGRTILNCKTSQKISFSSGDNNKMTMLANGNFGIGTTTPDVPLSVVGNNSVAIGDTYRYYEVQGDFGTFASSTTNRNISIRADRGIACNALYISSDERIKKDIVDVEDDEALVKLRQLQPKKYKYKDERSKGAREVIGFIAQQIGGVIPEALNITSDVIPNILDLGTVSSNVITFTNFNTSNLESNTSVLEVLGIDGGKHLVSVVEVISETSVRVQEDLSLWIGSVDEETGNVLTETNTETITLEEYEALENQDGFEPGESNTYSKSITTNVGSNLWVQGEKVSDFHTINKDAIFTVTTTAVQEIDRQQQSDKVRISELEARISALETVIAQDN